VNSSCIIELGLRAVQKRAITVSVLADDGSLGNRLKTSTGAFHSSKLLFLLCSFNALVSCIIELELQLTDKKINTPSSKGMGYLWRREIEVCEANSH
ncbi:hypothetical protein, partial [Streptococcus acidominimus]|uniref:hypothetical protein n=1 Tax=Streptococcus acidominimus TaxID=1326 RepID=UPI001ADD9B73